MRIFRSDLLLIDEIPFHSEQQVAAFHHRKYESAYPSDRNETITACFKLFQEVTGDGENSVLYMNRV